MKNTFDINLLLKNIRTYVSMNISFMEDSDSFDIDEFCETIQFAFEDFSTIDYEFTIVDVMDQPCVERLGRPLTASTMKLQITDICNKEQTARELQSALVAHFRQFGICNIYMYTIMPHITANADYLHIRFGKIVWD